MNPLRTRRSALVTLGSAALLAASVPVPTPTPAVADERRPRPSVALDWYDTTAATVAAGGATTQITNNRTWAISWLAAARAVRELPPGVDRSDFQDAALASAVHDSLVALVPSRAQELDAALLATLAGVPDGPAKSRGVAAGARQARLVRASREGDGLDPASVNAAFTVPPAAPGVWQPTPPAYAPAAQYGNRIARPFLLNGPDQYRLPAPPALDSARYRADLAEVRAYGAVDSTIRTQRQTETAVFWFGSSLTLYTEPLRVALARSSRSTAGQAGLVALFHVALVDTQIATSDSKYAYLRWRPVTAIRTGTIDPDSEWTPLHVTPAHPDYPSGHNTYAGSAETVLTALTGPRTAPFDLTSPTAPGVTRTYTAWSQLSQDNLDARVYSGIHTRSADEAGLVLGKRVAAHTLHHAARLFDTL
ncbi:MULTISPECIES: vanadium-dependent haloperoxidase [unclassified Streptomyces]|uniref:vanadium-dependent haloperoxidase n=1 Tax=unclassified Streptomyces TaxID=2593676 RepID=UPI002E7FB96E|nr:vanadium-dependent haloperoxidase [Streptomyces sp. NBC_00589]WTI33864.1 vanadium-dependent haloperoxidase [Streptomyces sp. NBC_00775]WUB32463.1 vanadium-dependent haloperoxidase [Streptomyces sp. NBC_00589]